MDTTINLPERSSATLNTFMNDTFSTLVTRIIVENHGPGTLIGDYLAGKSAEWLLDWAKQNASDAYHQLEAKLESHIKSI